MSRYIDADELVLWIKDVWDWDTVDGIKGTTILRQMITDIENTDTADVREVVRGEWKMEIDTGVRMLKCSCCGSRVKAEKYAEAVGTKGYRFCCYCGAEMRGET